MSARTTAVIVDAVRTPIGRHGGGLAPVRPDDLAAYVIGGLLDRVDLEPGQLRFRAQGSSGGHRGIESIIECLGRRDFQRLKFGVGRDERRDTADFVLSGFEKELEEKIKNDIFR